MTVPDRPWQAGLRPLYPALAVGVVALGLGLAAGAGRIGTTVAVFAVQVLLALAWLAFTDTPGSLAPPALLLGAAGVADVLAWQRQGAGIGAAGAVVGLAVVAALGWQLALRERGQVVEAVAGAVSGAVLVVFAAHLIAVRASRGGRALLATALLAVVAALLAGRALDAALPRPRMVPGALRGWPGAVGGTAAACAAGFVLGGLWAPLSAASGAVTGAAVGVTAVAADLAVDVAVADVVDARRIAAARPLGALLPVALAAPVAYAAARLLVG